MGLEPVYCYRIGFLSDASGGYPHTKYAHFKYLGTTGYFRPSSAYIFTLV